MKITPKRIRVKFEKLRGDNPFAKTWEEVPHELQSSMLQGLVLDGGEIPVCAITAPPNPVVITASRIIWRSNSVTCHLPLTELSSVEAPESFHTDKLDMSQLLVTTNSGEKYLLVTAPGKTLFVLWNMLLSFTRWNRKLPGVKLLNQP